jgi:predicted esterase YcpF (UPF0227 family)
MTIYIHGFGSSGQGGKSCQFREYFESIDEPFIAPSLSYVPELAIATLEELIESYDDVTLMGSSLGGYYGMYLAQKYALRCVLINPSTEPTVTLRSISELNQTAKNYYDESRFDWLESHLLMLEKYAVAEVTRGKYMLMLQKEDDTLDYRKAVQKLPQATLILEEGGSHAFDNVQRHFAAVRAFLCKPSQTIV